MFRHHLRMYGLKYLVENFSIFANIRAYARARACMSITVLMFIILDFNYMA